MQIEGMHCPMCEDHVNDKIRRVRGVRSVKSSHRKGIAVVVLEEGTNREEVRNAVASMGYRFLSESEKPYQKRSLFDKIFHR